ncbi:uncharacterized protein JCM15063_002923 [Sporobolomyces koalae]|uniref:uncharacterized protein n=1 Tax=Sporobolomyces koalae TaxID=500713 RepID=UPI003176F3A4
MASFDESSYADEGDPTRPSRINAAPRSRPLLDPHHLTLGSVAESFRSEDYAPAPPGINQDLWTNMIRAERKPSSRAPSAHPTLVDVATEYEYDQSASGLGQSTTDTPHETFNETTTASTSAVTLDEPSRTGSEQSDRTELLSERLPQSKSITNSSSTLDFENDGADETGGDSALLRRATKATMTSKHGARGSGNIGNGQNMTLREQEKVIDELKKDNFSLKLKLHFYEQRLEKMAPSSVEQALRENIQLKVEFQTLRTELKRYKKLLLEGDKALRRVTQERDELDETVRTHRGAATRPRGSTAAAARERELEREVQQSKEQRDDWEKKARELQRALKGATSAEEVEELRAQLEEALADSDDLKRHLQDATDELDDLRDEVGGLRRDLADQADQSVTGSVAGDRSRGIIRREVEKLEQDNANLRSQLTAQLTMLSTRNDEKDALLQELDTYRDRSTSLSIELEDTKAKLDEKEREIEELIAELDEKDRELQDLATRVDEEWRDEVEGARQAEKEAKDALEERETDVQQLADKVEQLARELTERKAELAAGDEEIDALTNDLQKLGAQIFTLEEELDAKDKEVADLDHEYKVLEKELEEKQSTHEQIVVALKDKLVASKSKLSEKTIHHESATTETAFLRLKIEDLAVQNARLVEQGRQDDEEKQKLQKEAEEIMEALKKEEDERDADEERFKRDSDRLRKELEETEADYRASQNDVKQLRSLVATRESDLDSLQSALNSLRRQGENADTDRAALDLEAERAKRDSLRAESEIRELREELDNKIRIVRQLESEIANLESEQRELQGQVASQTQTRLALADKFDDSSQTLRETQTELSSARDRLRLLEDQLTTDHRELSKTENNYRDMVNERNTLLLTVYEYMDRISSSSDKRKAMSSSLQDSPKPFSDFGVFHKRLLERLQTVSLMQPTFERKVKDVENRLTAQLTLLQRQQEDRMRQIDKFETGLKTATENQKQWRTRVQQRTLELQQAQSTVKDLQEQLLQLRRSPAPSASGSPTIPRSPNSAAETALQNRLVAAQSRTTTLERRLAATTKQLGEAEEMLKAAQTKTDTAEDVWGRRLRELESRCRAAEEKVKRERQGAKERVNDLQTIIKRLQDDLDGAQHRKERIDQLDRAQRQQQEGSP